MKTRDEIEAELHKLGWKITAAPTKVHGGWKATVQRGTASVSAVGNSALDVLEDLLRHVQQQAGRWP